MDFQPAPLAPELLVTSLAGSLKFYQALGFKTLFGRQEESFVYLEMGNVHIMLLQVREDIWWQKAPLEKPFGRGINFQTLVSDVEQVRTNLGGRHNIVADIQTKTYKTGDKTLTLKEMMVADPDGYLWRLQQELVF